MSKVKGCPWCNSPEGYDDSLCGRCSRDYDSFEAYAADNIHPIRSDRDDLIAALRELSFYVLEEIKVTATAGALHDALDLAEETLQRIAPESVTCDK